MLCQWEELARLQTCLRMAADICREMLYVSRFDKYGADIQVLPQQVYQVCVFYHDSRKFNLWWTRNSIRTSFMVVIITNLEQKQKSA